MLPLVVLSHTVKSLTSTKDKTISQYIHGVQTSPYNLVLWD